MGSTRGLWFEFHPQDLGLEADWWSEVDSFSLLEAVSRELGLGYKIVRAKSYFRVTVYSHRTPWSFMASDDNLRKAVFIAVGESLEDLELYNYLRDES